MGVSDRAGQQPSFAKGFGGHPASHPGAELNPAKPVRAKQNGGARRDRTDDLMLAKHALYQLSYGPSFAPDGASEGGPSGALPRSVCAAQAPVLRSLGEGGW